MYNFFCDKVMMAIGLFAKVGVYTLMLKLHKAHIVRSSPLEEFGIELKI
jgi:hypothetical protein